MRRAATALSLAALAAAAGCGEREYSASEFVEEANAHGAGLELGEPLLSSREDTEVYAVEVEPVAATGELGADAHDAHGGGSLTITADSEAGAAEYERCEGAETLVCYRAANVVLAVEDELGADELVGVDGAIRALASD